jgi:hypothetical protein
MCAMIHVFGHVAPLVLCCAFPFIFVVAVFLLWVLPITLGLRAAHRNNYSPLWMLFGIHPLGGWIAYIVLANLPPRTQCTNCGGFVTVNFRICPHCHSALTPPAPPPQV